MHAFVGRYGAEVAMPLDRRKVDGVRWVSLEALTAMVTSGRIRDGMTLATLALALASGEAATFA